MLKIKQLISDFIGLLYPNTCVGCGKSLNFNENCICTACLYNLAKTNFHLTPENPVSRMFWGRANIQNATAFFYFQKGTISQKMLHGLKYNGAKEVGLVLGKYFGSVLSTCEAYGDIDFAVPIPLHPKRQKERGYNQSEWIAKGIAESLNCQLSADNLFRKIYTKTQTKKSRQERWENVEDIFSLRKPEVYENKHILLIDDVVTTGSTLESCAAQLLKINNTRVSIACLAIA